MAPGTNGPGLDGLINKKKTCMAEAKYISLKDKVEEKT